MIAQLVGSEVATDSAKSLADLEPLLDGLRVPSAGEREMAGKMVAHTVGSLLASRKDFADEKNTVWYEWAERVSDPATGAVVGPLASLLGHWLSLIADDRPSENPSRSNRRTTHRIRRGQSPGPYVGLSSSNRGGVPYAGVGVG